MDVVWLCSLCYKSCVESIANFRDGQYRSIRRFGWEVCLIVSMQK